MLNTPFSHNVFGFAQVDVEASERNKKRSLLVAELKDLTLTGQLRADESGHVNFKLGRIIVRDTRPGKNAGITKYVTSATAPNTRDLINNIENFTLTTHFCELFLAADLSSGKPLV